MKTNKNPVRKTLFSSNSTSSIINNEPSSLTMPVDVYRFWFDALHNADMKTVADILSSTVAAERNKLLNGSFDFMVDQLHLQDMSGQGLAKPLSVCIFYNSFHILPILIDYGIKLEDTDAETRDNILHLLVKRVLLYPEEEELIIDTYK